MIDILSETNIISAASQKVYAKLIDLNNLGHNLPPQIQNWQVDGTECSFEIENMAKISMLIFETKEPNFILIKSQAPSPFPFSLSFHLEDIDTGSCKSFIKMEVDVNVMLGTMVKKPLTKFANLLNDQLKNSLSF